METPNTRSMRKRALLSSQEKSGDTLQWVHDQEARLAVMQSASDQYMEPPTPTQKPRPISSRLATSPADRSTPGSSSSTTRARKRRCRNTSQPGSNYSTPGTTIITPDSRAGERLEDLLAQFELEKANNGFGENSPLRPMSTNIAAPSPLRQTTTSSESIKTINTSYSTSTSTSRSLPVGRSRVSGSNAYASSSTFARPSAKSLPNVSSGSTELPRPQPRSQYSPTKCNAPRIGLRSSQHAAAPATARRPDINKAFKTPLLAHNQPTRSSPRRQQGTARTIVQAQTPIRAATARRKQASEEDETMENAPSSDGPTTGDESFDSFDGIFAEGGDDVEQLLKTLDGNCGRK